ncbi:MAG: sodium/glutamate symporter [Mesosutterella sp.]|nr:sodium/glutamate symporter [Mesosutterella sp.]
MDYAIKDGILMVNVSAVQAVALAVITYFFGVWAKKKISILERLSIPSPVVGGMTFAVILSILDGCGVMKVHFDSSLQTLFMLAFYTTVGLMASFKLIKKGGKLLVCFFLAVSVLCFLQNGVGIALATMMGIDMHYGILSGSISMMGGLGTAAAFGPFFEQTYGVTGGTAVGITSATFGMVAALLLGGPFGEWVIRRYKVKTPKKVGEPEPELRIPADTEVSVTDQKRANTPTMTDELMKAGSIVALCIAGGMIVSSWLGHFITLPAYIGSMIVAAILRNIGDFSGLYKVDGKGMNAVADISLVLFVTMAINSLKLYELIHLAIPMMVILAAQTVLMLGFAWLVFIKLFGNDYDNVMLAVGGIGFGMGATVNGLANMQAIGEKYGTSARAWLIVSIVGAFLIDFVNALVITWMGTLPF